MGFFFFIFSFFQWAKASREPSLKFPIRPICLPFPFPQSPILPTLLRTLTLQRNDPWKPHCHVEVHSSGKRFKLLLSVKQRANIYCLWTHIQVLLYSPFYFILYFRKQDFFPHEQVQIRLTFVTLLKDND